MKNRNSLFDFRDLLSTPLKIKLQLAEMRAFSKVFPLNLCWIAVCSWPVNVLAAYSPPHRPFSSSGENLSQNIVCMYLCVCLCVCVCARAKSIMICCEGVDFDFIVRLRYAMSLGPCRLSDFYSQKTTSTNITIFNIFNFSQIRSKISDRINCK